MNSKKESKKNKQKQQQNPLSLTPRLSSHDYDFNTLNLRDLSPMPNTYGSNYQQSHIHLSNTQLTIIQTPANLPSKPSYLEQIDEGHKHIIGVIDWDQNCQGQQEIQSGDDSSILQLSESDNSQEQKKNQVQQNDKKQQQKQGKNINHNLRTAQPKQKRDSNKKLFQSSSTISNSTKKVTCNCKKTKCLKLYCDCFRINQNCDGCNCVGCHNLSIYDQQRNNAMLSLMDRNPQAFKPKIDEQQHAKGCHCKKSNCLKKYCECFQAGLKCGTNCKCEQCKNCQDSHDKSQGNNNSSNYLTINIQNLLIQQKQKQKLRLELPKNDKKIQVQLSMS